MTRGEESRKRIVERALRIASTEGLEGLTLGPLAAALGISKSGLFTHFGSKEELQIAVIQEASEAFIRQVVAPALAQPRGEPRVRRLFEGHLDWVERNVAPGGCLFMTASVEFDDKPGAVHDKLLQVQNDWMDALTRAAEIAVKEKHFHRSTDPRQVALEMESLALGYNYALRLLHEPKARHRAEAAFEALMVRARGH